MIIYEIYFVFLSELEAYSSVMNAFRTQGVLTDDKIRILKELRVAFHISDDRHKAEARRVSNDERLNTIADIISGCETSRSWTKEGRRTIPLIPRGLAETAFIKVADTLSQRYTKQNDKMPHPSKVIVSRPETVIFPGASRIPPVPLFEEKSVIFDEKVAIKLEERIPLTIEDDTIGWSRKRRSSTENINLNQKLYPHVMKAQQSTGKRGAAKRPRKEKVAKTPNAPTSTTTKYIDFEDSINRAQERPNRDDGYNMRIIHSYASNSLPLTTTNVKNSNKRHTQQSDYSGSNSPMATSNTKSTKVGGNNISLPQTPPLASNVVESHNNQVSTKPVFDNNITVIPGRCSSDSGNQQNPLITPIAASSKPAGEKPPKIQILSNNPVKIIPSLSLKTLQAKGNVQVVQSPPGKVVLRSFNNDAEQAETRVTEIKGIPQTIAGAKLSVQKVHLMPVQSANSKSNANFLIVRNSTANTGKIVSGSSVANITKDHMNIPVSTIQTLNVGKDGQLICVPQISTTNSTNNKKDPSKVVTATFTTTKNISTTNLQPIPIKPLTGTTVTKLDAEQSLQKIRLIPTTSTVARPLPTTTTQIKLSKNSKLYPITYNNGTPFTEMYVVNRNNSPKSVSLVKNNENIENEKVDWENELDKKRGQQKGGSSSRVIVQSIPSIQNEGISSLKNADIVGKE